MRNVYFCIMKKIFDIDFIAFSKEAANVYFRYPDVLQKYLPTINQQLACQLVTFILNDSPAQELNTHMHTLFTALVSMQMIIPNVAYEMSRQNISIGTILRQLVLFDIQSGYKTDKGITEIVSLPVLYEESKQAVLFRASVISQLEKVFKFEFDFYNQIIKTLAKTQPFFLECQKKVQAAKT